jgi:hypothetical protein
MARGSLPAVAAAFASPRPFSARASMRGRGGTLRDVEPPVEEPQADDWPYDADGVDRSLIRWMLSLTPTERLETVESVITMLETTRRDGSNP